MMHKIKLVLKLFIRVFFTFKRTGKVKLNDISAEYIIWTPHFFTIHFLINDNLQKSLGAFYYLKQNNKKVSLYTKKDIGRFHNKKIIYYGSTKYNVFGFNNYMDILIYVSKNLENQGNRVFPSSYEISLWENKANMHNIFEEKNIRTPKTIPLDILNINKSIVDTFVYPGLLKEEHSCSSKGIYKVNCKEDVYAILAKKEIKNNNKTIVLQQLLEIRKDFRVILVGDSIVLHYWRINLSEEWKPTATGQGSQVDFETFPEQWRTWIIETFSKLGIRTGAFDIAWQNDDLSTEPYILEVSPFYQPNPRPDNPYDLMHYGKWKKSVRLIEGYQQKTIDTIFAIQKIFIEDFIR